MDIVSIFKKTFTIYRTFMLVLIFLIYYLFNILLNGNDGIKANTKLKQELYEIRKENKIQERKNKDKYAEIVSLSNNNEVITSISRSELGTMKKDEKYFIIVNKKSS